MLGIETVHCLSMDSDTQIAAGEAAEIMEECKLHGITKLFAEEAYAESLNDTFGKELDREIVVLDPVTGAGTKSAGGDGTGGGTSTGKIGVFLYCDSMRENLKCVKQAYGVR